MELLSPDIAEMKRLVQKKADHLLVELSESNLDYFKIEASIIAECILERYIFAIYDYYTHGESAIIEPTREKAFTDYKIGYQQKMLDWKELNKPEIKHTDIMLNHSKKSIGKCWCYATLGIGTAGAVGLVVCHCYWLGLILESLTLVVSYYLFVNEKKCKKEYKRQQEQHKSALGLNKESVVKEVINQLEDWIKLGENYSNDLLTTYIQQ